MRIAITQFKERYRAYFTERALVWATAEAFALLAVSLCVNYFAGVYASAHASNPVTDIILNNFAPRDVDGLFIYGSVVFGCALAAILLAHPRRISFALKSIALFAVVRSVFIVLTHIAPFPGEALPLRHSVLGLMTFTGDLFFSGHTGLPFLLALLFWHDARLRYFFLAASAAFAVIVLVGHYHYSIDVFAAFFISYAIAELAKFFFKNDYARFY